LTTSIVSEKAYDKNPTPITVKTHEKLGIGENFLNLTKDIFEKPTAKTRLNGEKLGAFPKRSRPRPRQECLLPLFLLDIVLEFLATIISKGNKEKAPRVVRERSKTISICRWHGFINRRF
jgi:hypothetical protein